MTFSVLPLKPKMRGRHPPEYDTSSESVRRLASAFRGKIIYLYEKSSDAENLQRLLRLELDVLYHVSGYCHRHIWDLLLMARVALVYIEYLALASLLLSALSDFTIFTPGLPSQIQTGHAGRERTISVPWMYFSETFYLEEISQFRATCPDNTPCLVYMGGLGRLNESFAICVAMEILHRCGGRLCIRLQTNPDTMYSELKRIASQFCAEQGWSDLSNNIRTFPHHYAKKLHMLDGASHTRMVAIAVGSVGQHTGTVDANLQLIPCVGFCGPKWSGQVPHVNNNLLGLGAVLNATSREDMIDKCSRLLQDPELLDGVVAHMESCRRLRVRPYKANP